MYIMACAPSPFYFSVCILGKSMHKKKLVI